MVDKKIIAVLLILIGVGVYFFFLQPKPVPVEEKLTFAIALGQLESTRSQEGIQFNALEPDLLTYSDAKLNALKSKFTSFKSTISREDFASAEEKSALLSTVDLYSAYLDVLKAKRAVIENRNALPSSPSDSCDQLPTFETLFASMANLKTKALSFNTQLETYATQYSAYVTLANIESYYSDPVLLDLDLQQAQSALTDLQSVCR